MAPAEWAERGVTVETQVIPETLVMLERVEEAREVWAATTLTLSLVQPHTTGPQHYLQMWAVRALQVRLRPEQQAVTAVRALHETSLLLLRVTLAAADLLELTAQAAVQAMAEVLEAPVMREQTA
jgi:hypothetical protein